MALLKDIKDNFYINLSAHYDKGEIDHIFFALTEAYLGYSKIDYLNKQNEVLEENIQQQFHEALQRLERDEPLQYVVGKAWFLGRPYEVNKSVLIPRPETEELVDLIIRDTKGQSGSLRMIDIGTGSGCIPISLKLQFPEAVVSGVDISREALEVAKKNAYRYEAAVNFMLMDILEWDSVFMNEQCYDVIVSNPPYITPDEKVAMHPNVLQYEPHMALFVEGQAPLLFYETIASFGLSHLRAGGKLYFEINKNYGTQVCDLLRKKGYKHVELIQDMQGADRIVRALLEA
ncbi:peptide chain release factor N(5)-glutamine methyltransferase [Olivibacter sitiensis]|uniref:peptide chain release factor N(5)-glutamine methyltransferase n=1 Tax=Olivibacter sitiensis TaxID=376470 RepID=UPI0004247182|nr:peptide chain release factor N(5)-glutamine methyltransferase [Olivibacter sitiensis]